VDFLSLKKEAKDRQDLNNFEDFLVETKGKVKAKSLHLTNKIYNQLPVKFDKKLFFNRPQTLYRLEEHPLVQAADIIHFHITSFPIVSVQKIFTLFKASLIRLLRKFFLSLKMSMIHERDFSIY
jgi:hypothetical protein